MNFGHESGAKLAGTWMDNLKHGPGVMICGNGVILEKNPLFTDDKPSAYAPPKTSNSTVKGSALTSFVSISKQILSKVPPTPKYQSVILTWNCFRSNWQHWTTSR